MNDCIFCKIVKGEAKSWKVYENEKVYAFLDINPISRFHTLVIPKKHYKDIFDIPEEELKEVISIVKKLAQRFKDKLGIENMQILNNNGRAGQQDVFHIHYHIIPRRKNDGQNMKWKNYPELRKEFEKMLQDLD